MNYDDALLTYIQVAVAFAGFAALITAIRDRGSDVPNPHLWVRLRGMVELALLVAVFSVGAISIRSFGVSNEITWRICSALLAVAWPAEFLFVVARAQRLNRTGFPFGTRPYRYFLYSIALLSTASLVTNALGWWSSSAGAVYFTNLGALLLVAGLWFMRLVAGVIPGSAPPNGATQQAEAADHDK